MSEEVAVVDRCCAVVCQHDIHDDITIYISKIRINIYLFPHPVPIMPYLSCRIVYVVQVLEMVHLSDHQRARW
jgi:hypothetical protein